MTLKFSVMLGGMFPMENYAHWARQIEAAGFDEIHVADDLIFRPAWPILTLVAGATREIKLGPSIVTPQIAHPAYHAMNLLALDELSGGRAVCGVGRGAFAGLIKLPRPEKSVKYMREAVLALQYVVSGRSGGIEGEYFSIGPDFAPHFDRRRTDIPVFVGTWGLQIAKMAAEITSGVMASCAWDPVWLGRLEEQIRAGERAAGRPAGSCEFGVTPVSAISADRRAARTMMATILAQLQPLLAPMTQHAGISDEQIGQAAAAFAAGDLERAHGLISETAFRAFTITGTPEDVIPQIEAALAAGVTHVNFGPPLGPDPDEAIRLLGSRVLPYFRQGRS